MQTQAQTPDLSTRSSRDPSHRVLYSRTTPRALTSRDTRIHTESTIVSDPGFYADSGAQVLPAVPTVRRPQVPQAGSSSLELGSDSNRSVSSMTSGDQQTPLTHDEEVDPVEAEVRDCSCVW